MSHKFSQSDLGPTVPFEGMQQAQVGVPYGLGNFNPLPPPPYARLLDSDIERIARAVVGLMKQAQAEQHNDTANLQAASAENLAAAAKHHQSKTD